jgi:hypothetical protein
MKWTIRIELTPGGNPPITAHYLLQVRAELLNGTLLDGYRTANPRFRGPSGFSYATA